jgi:hypothetical protein
MDRMVICKMLQVLKAADNFLGCIKKGAERFSVKSA